MILALGYWVLSDIFRHGIVLLLGDILFVVTPNSYNTNQTTVSTIHNPHASERLFSSTCDLYSDSRNRLSGYHAVY